MVLISSLLCILRFIKFIASLVFIRTHWFLRPLQVLSLFFPWRKSTGEWFKGSHIACGIVCRVSSALMMCLSGSDTSHVDRLLVYGPLSHSCLVLPHNSPVSSVICYPHFPNEKWLIEANGLAQIPIAVKRQSLDSESDLLILNLVFFLSTMQHLFLDQYRQKEGMMPHSGSGSLPRGAREQRFLLWMLPDPQGQFYALVDCRT